MTSYRPINFDCVDAVTTKRSSRSGRGLLVTFIHTEMDAIFQPIKKSDTYQIKLLKYKKKLENEMRSLYSLCNTQCNIEHRCFTLPKKDFDIDRVGNSIDIVNWTVTDAQTSWIQLYRCKASSQQFISLVLYCL